jgi:hypothetical protein
LTTYIPKKLENLEKMDKFLDTYDHPKLNQMDINNLSRSITCNKIKAAIVSPKTKVQDLMFHCQVLPDLQRRTKTNTPLTLPQNKKGRNTA